MRLEQELEEVKMKLQRSEIQLDKKAEVGLPQKRSQKKIKTAEALKINSEPKEEEFDSEINNRVVLREESKIDN